MKHRPGEVNRVTLLGREVDFRLRTSTRARSLRVVVGPGGVEVVVPQRARLVRPTAFLIEHAAWVVSQLEKAERRRAEEAAAFALPPGHFLLRGTATPLVALPHGRRRHKIELAAGRVVVWGEAASAGQALERWLRAEARRDLAARVAHHAAGVRKQPGKLVVRDQRTRWGSCAAAGTLSFNWRLVLAPPAVLDYVAAHEVAHLDVPNHSRGFWQRVRDLCGDYAPHRDWLRRHGNVLMRDPADALGAAGR